MMPNVRDRALQSNGVSESQEFGISKNDTSHIMTILRDTLYSDKVLAVLREYAANAWDAHRAAGKGDLPIFIMLPTSVDPVLSIRDCGNGLSHEDVFNVFTQYGASTKRNNDSQVGMLGIGSKSGFSYADSFTITSWNGGMKRVYVSVLDASDKGVCNLLHEEPCDADETGVMIQIAVQPDDIEEFTNKARTLYKHFEPRPFINIELPPVAQKLAALKNGYLFNNSDLHYGERNWLAVMGCIPYRIDLRQLVKAGEALPLYMERVSGILNFNIGDVEINASREELKYSVSTKAAIVAKMTALVDEFVERTLAEIESTSTTKWERRLKLQVFKQFGLLNLTKVEKGLDDDYIHLDDGGYTSFHLTHERRDDNLKKVLVSEETRFVLKDDNRQIKGFSLSNKDYIVRKAFGQTWAKVEEELNKMIETKGMTGVPVVKISTLPWSQPYNRRYHGRSRTAGHASNLKVFVLSNPTAHVTSERWSPVVDHEPSDTDVWVVLDRFNTDYSLISRDRALFEALDMEMPTIYGYRSTEKNPVQTDKLLGQEYGTWSNKARSELFVEKADLMAHVAWKAHFTNNIDKKSATELVKKLGPTHQISKMFQSYLRAIDVLDVLSWDVQHQLGRLLAHRDVKMFPDSDLEHNIVEEAIKARYPLLFTGVSGYYGHCLSRLMNADDGAEWIEYVRMVDAFRPIEVPAPAMTAVSNVAA